MLERGTTKRMPYKSGAQAIILRVRGQYHIEKPLEFGLTNASYYIFRGSKCGTYNTFFIRDFDIQDFDDELYHI